MSKHGHFSSAPVPTLISYFNKGGIMFFDYLTARTFRFYTNFQTDLQSKPRQKRKPRALGSRGRSFASFGRMGDVNPSALDAKTHTHLTANRCSTK